MIIPFFEILFDQVQLVSEKPELRASVDSMILWGKYHYSQMIVRHNKQSALLMVCAALVIVFLLKNIFRYLSLAFLVPVRNGLIKELRQKLFEKVLVLPMSFYSGEQKGDLIARFSTDVQEIENSILNVLEALIKSPLVIAGCIGFMLYVNPALTVFVFVLIVFTALIIGGISRTLKRTSLLAQNKLGNIISMVEETIGGLKIVKGFGAERFFSNHFSDQNNNYKQLLNRIMWRRDLSSPLSEFLGIVVVSILLWYGSNQVFNGEIDPGTFFAFLFAFFNVIEPAKSFSKAYYNVQKGMAALDRVELILGEPLRIEEHPNPKRVFTVNDNIQFENVWFSYSSDQNAVLADINLIIPVGKTIALVGASGAGKTTIADLMNRFYDVERGKILVDRTDIREIKLTDLRALYAIVSQEPVVFNDSVYNNIVFGMDGFDQKDVEAAARAANAHQFIMNLENGYQSNVGDRGMRLSGGQRQRITLARAILKNAPVLILDEATSALDSESEKEVQSALRKIVKGRTVVVIAHRLSTIQNADLIYVLKDGRIIETGKHTDLLKRGGEYKKFVELQVF